MGNLSGCDGTGLHGDNMSGLQKQAYVFPSVRSVCVCVMESRSSSMHRSYQPLQPVTNRYLQRRWDQKNYENHRCKVSSALPAVDTKGCRTHTHMLLKPKKLQLQEERLSVIDRDNRLLSAKLASIVQSKGLVDHRNQYQPRSLNAQKRNQELLLVGHQNQAIYQRITARQSEYRRQLWLNDWEKTERRLDDVSRFPKRLEEKHKCQWKVRFTSEESVDSSTGGSRVFHQHE